MDVYGGCNTRVRVHLLKIILEWDHHLVIMVEVGPSKVVQVVTDNAPICKVAV